MTNKKNAVLKSRLGFTRVANVTILYTNCFLCISVFLK